MEFAAQATFNRIVPLHRTPTLGLAMNPGNDVGSAVAERPQPIYLGDCPALVLDSHC